LQPWSFVIVSINAFSVIFEIDNPSACAFMARFGFNLIITFFFGA